MLQLVSNRAIQCCVDVTTGTSTITIHPLDKLNNFKGLRERFVSNVHVHVWNATQDGTLEQASPQIIEITKVIWFVCRVREERTSYLDSIREVVGVL